MTSRAYQISSRVAKPRSQSLATMRRSPAREGTSTALVTNSWDTADASTSDATLTTHKVHGGSTEAEVRQRQMQKYSEDKVKFQQKEKEKADKKRAEKFQRYSHVDLGSRLGVPANEDNSNAMMSIRQQQQAQYSDSSSNTLRLDQERTEKQAKEDDQKRKMKLWKYPNVTNGQTLSEEYVLGSQSIVTNQNTTENKEEEFRQRMRLSRERMQNQYDQTAKPNM